MRATLIATALLFTSLAQADDAKAQPYTYGTRLDVAQGLPMSPHILEISKPVIREQIYGV